MNEVMRKVASIPALRVGVLAPGIKRASWERLLETLGHVSVAVDTADVILAEGEIESSLNAPIVRVGRGSSDVQGQLPPNATAEQIDAALRAVAAGLIVKAPQIAEAGFRGLGDLNEKALLTPRELEVLAAIAEGLTNKAIARRLGISLHTVKFHTESVFRKLGVRTRSEATARALERLRADRITI